MPGQGCQRFAGSCVQASMSAVPGCGIQRATQLCFTGIVFTLAELFCPAYRSYASVSLTRMGAVTRSRILAARISRPCSSRNSVAERPTSIRSERSYVFTSNCLVFGSLKPA